MTERDRDMEILRRASVQLMEHFETVQIFVTRDNGPEGETMAANYGGGNWYARSGQIREWIVQQDVRAAENIKRQDEAEGEP